MSERKIYMNLPNKLTMLRLIFVPFYVFFLLMTAIPHHYLIALIIFAAAAYTDHLDGKIARKYNMVTDFGKFADPLADKIMIFSALACFIQLGLTGAVVLIITAAREFAVTSVRLVAADKGKVVAANIWGKLKTVSQIAAVLAVMLLQYIMELSSLGIIHFENTPAVSAWFCIIGESLLWISVLFAVISGVIYICQNFDFIKNAK